MGGVDGWAGRVEGQLLVAEASIDSHVAPDQLKVFGQCMIRVRPLYSLSGLEWHIAREVMAVGEHCSVDEYVRPHASDLRVGSTRFTVLKYDDPSAHQHLDTSVHC